VLDKAKITIVSYLCQSGFRLYEQLAQVDVEELGDLVEGFDGGLFVVGAPEGDGRFGLVQPAGEFAAGDAFFHEDNFYPVQLPFRHY